jgi:hypothetical protein
MGFIHYAKVVHNFRACCQWPYLLCQRHFHNLQTGCCKALHKCLMQVHNCKLTTKDPLVSMIVKLWDCLLGHMGFILHVIYEFSLHDHEVYFISQLPTKFTHLIIQLILTMACNAFTISVKNLEDVQKHPNCFNV